MKSSNQALLRQMDQISRVQDAILGVYGRLERDAKKDLNGHVIPDSTLQRHLRQKARADESES